MKICGICKGKKDISTFNKTESKKKSGWCRECVRIYNKNYFHTPTGRKNKIEANKKWKIKNPEKVDSYLRKSGERKLKLRFSILEKFNFKCVYCGRPSNEVSLQIDHIIPRAKGGTDDIKNLISACEECNLGKSDKLLTNFPFAH